MELSRLLPYRSIITPIVGLAAGIALVAILAPSPPPESPVPPPNRESRPNISSLRLPEKLDFAGEPVPLEDPEVRKRMDREFLLNLQWDGQVMLYLKRSGEYFEMYDRILKEEGAPNDLKYLSVAESALFQAQSSKGAVGLWQFIPETGRRYGLKIDDYVDERRNPEKSTRAAIRLLKDNYKRFGSWGLSAAAYNMGEAAVQDDISFQGGRTYYDLYLNEETSRYLFRVVALKEILSHPERYGYFLKKDDYYAMPPTRTVTVDQEITNLAQWAQSQGTSYKNVKLLNPWILKRTLPKPASGQPYQIAVPVREGR
jgi:membrane-bound lytic murein transglycosylase D